MDYAIAVYLAIGCSAGFIGSMVGLGGGIIVVPVLTILMNIDIRQAISASLISLVATSVMSVPVFTSNRLIHFKFGLMLSLFTILGSFLGSYIAVFTPAKTLMIIFALILFAAGYVLFKKNRRNPDNKKISVETDTPSRNSMNGMYLDYHGNENHYVIRHAAGGMTLSGFAGVVSGMLGVGGGLLQVPVMNLLCGMPLKAATATSSFIIGYAGLAGGLVYYMFGNIEPVMTASLIVGILSGAYIGAKLAVKLKTVIIANILIVVLLVSAVRMLLKAYGV